MKDEGRELHAVGTSSESDKSNTNHNIYFLRYCNLFDQRVARQQISKHGTLRNDRRCCVFYVVRVSRKVLAYDQLLGYAAPR
jgi:hypothetical protein